MFKIYYFTPHITKKNINKYRLNDFKESHKIAGTFYCVKF